MTDYSIVLPIYQEKENIHAMVAEIDQAFSDLGNGASYEIIAVNDGSTDGTAAVLNEVAATKDYLKVVHFRRNYGQSTAFTAGFHYACGDFVVTMDSDLQNDPRDIFKLKEKLDEGFDFVTGWRKKRQDFFLRTFISKIANYIIRKVTQTRLSDMGCSLKLYRKEVVKNLFLYGEMHRFISVLVENEGYKTSECVVNHRPRVAGVSKYGFIRVFKVVLDLFLIWFIRAYQTKSMYIFGGVGITSMGLSGLISLFVLYQKFFHGVWAHKNPLFIIAVFLGMISLQFFGMGILSEIINRTYFESQGKVTYSVGNTINLESAETLKDKCAVD